MSASHRKFALVYTGAGVGNVIFTTPAMRVLHSLGYTVDCLVDFADAYILGLLTEQSFLRHTYTACPRQNYDVILYAQPRRQCAGRFASSLRIDGQELVAPRFVDCPHLSEAAATCEPLRELGWNGTVPMPVINIGRVVPGPYVCLFPDCKPDRAWWVKHWHKDRWVELSRRVRAAGHVPVLVSDDPESTVWAREGRALDLGGLTSLRDAAGIIAGSRAVIGIDNGLIHIAAALRVPVVVLWGPASWVKNMPIGGGLIMKVGPTSACAPCHYGHWAPWPAGIRCGEPPLPCMNQIVDEVFAALMEILDEKAAQ